MLLLLRVLICVLGLVISVVIERFVMLFIRPVSALFDFVIFLSGIPTVIVFFPGGLGVKVIGLRSSARLLLALDSFEIIRRLVIFEISFTVRRLGNILDFLVIEVVIIIVIIIAIVVVTFPVIIIIVGMIFLLLVFAREVKLEKKLAHSHTLTNILFSCLPGGQYIPALHKLLNFIQVLGFPQCFIYIIYIILVV